MNISDHQLMADESTVEWYLVLSILAFYSVAGIAGNGLVLYVFSCRSDGLVSSLFIVALAVADLTTCSLVIPGTAYMEYRRYWITSDAFCKVYYFLATSTILYSVTVIVAIAVDRYFCLCHPWKQVVTRARAKASLVVLACLSAAHGTVMACGNGVKLEPDRDYGLELESFDCSLENVKKVLNESEHLTSAVLFECWQRENSSDENSFGARQMETCQESFRLVGKSALFYYKRAIMLAFGLCLLIVLVLYVAIYRSVTARRVKRIRNRRLGTQPTLVVALPKQSISVEPEGCGHHHHHQQQQQQQPAKSEEVAIAALPCEAQESINLASAVEMKSRHRKSAPRIGRPTALEVHVSENLKIAFMLFIVTIVFALSFLPAILILLGVIPDIPLVFYLYFVNNLSNPVIYSFLNVNFRNKLKQLLCYRAGNLRKNVCARF